MREHVKQYVNASYHSFIYLFISLMDSRKYFFKKLPDIKKSLGPWNTSYH